MSREKEIIRTHFYSKYKRPTNEYEHADKRICEYNLQRESCRNCLFEVLCNYQNMVKKNNVWTGWEENYDGLDMVD